MVPCYLFHVCTVQYHKGYVRMCTETGGRLVTLHAYTRTSCFDCEVPPLQSHFTLSTVVLGPPTYTEHTHTHTSSTKRHEVSYWDYRSFSISASVHVTKTFCSRVRCVFYQDSVWSHQSSLMWLSAARCVAHR